MCQQAKCEQMLLEKTVPLDLLDTGLPKTEFVRNAVLAKLQ